MVRLREGSPADAEAIASLHAESWRTAYRGILPDAYLDGPVLADRRSHWRKALGERTGRDILLVAELPDQQEPAGFIAVWTDGRDGPGGYIDNLHVRPSLKGSGIGRRLLGEAATRLSGQGLDRAHLWVFDANRQAYDFYRRLGAQVAERGHDDFAGASIAHSRLIWQDLKALARACGT